MHELGIVIHVAKTLDEVAAENKITKIGSVTLEVGEVSGIMTEYFTDCWNFFKKKHPVLYDAELKIEILPAYTFCEDCGKLYGTVKYGRTCPYCGSERTYLKTGNECNIREIEAEAEE